MFNKYFINLSSNQPLVHTKVKLNGHNNFETMFVNPIDTEEILKISISLNNSKTSGYDDIITSV